MDSTGLLELFREEVKDTDRPYLWSDTHVYFYIGEAQKMFCRLTEGIEDARTAGVTELDITTGQDWYDLSPKILKLRSAHRSDTGREVELMPAEMAERRGVRFDGRTGPPSVIVQGLEKNAVRVWPVPSEDITLNLRVFRLPLVDITDEGGQEFEIDEQHHYALLKWVKHLAYGKQDADTFDRKKTDDYEAEFRAYCRAARIEQGRARHPAGAVMYGGL